MLFIIIFRWAGLIYSVELWGKYEGEAFCSVTREYAWLWSRKETTIIKKIEFWLYLQGKFN